MENEGSKIIRIGTGRKCTDNIWYDESDSFDTFDEKMDVESPEVKEKRKRVTKGKKRGRKPKTQKTIEPESEAGPSGLVRREEAAVIEKGDSMVMCKYKKLSPDYKAESTTKPYEVQWGQQFLNTLSPNFEKKKGILKQSGAESKPKSHTRFSQTTVYYFERVNPHSRIRADKEITSSMEPHHFYSSHLPVDVFEQQKETRQKRNLAALECMDAEDDNENWKLHQTENDEDKNIIVHTIQVPAELMEEDVSKKNIVQSKPRGCGCNVYCDPDICECNLSGKQCEVFKDDFPCSCQLEFCKNTNGRVAYNSS